MNAVVPAAGTGTRLEPFTEEPNALVEVAGKPLLEHVFDSLIDIDIDDVFSTWGKNRVYTYFVNGESRSYGYAQSILFDFLASTDPPAWYDRLSPRRFVVVTPQAAETESDQLGSLLYSQKGSRTETYPGLAHYRLIYVSKDGEYKAFELVEGAIIRGQTSPNATV